MAVVMKNVVGTVVERRDRSTPVKNSHLGWKLLFCSEDSETICCAELTSGERNGGTDDALAFDPAGIIHSEGNISSAKAEGK